MLLQIFRRALQKMRSFSIWENIFLQKKRHMHPHGTNPCRAKHDAFKQFIDFVVN